MPLYGCPCSIRYLKLASAPGAILCMSGPSTGSRRRPNEPPLSSSSASLINSDRAPCETTDQRFDARRIIGTPNPSYWKQRPSSQALQRSRMVRLPTSSQVRSAPTPCEIGPSQRACTTASDHSWSYQLSSSRIHWSANRASSSQQFIWLPILQTNRAGRPYQGRSCAH